jgi:tRNA (cytidine/uridine-2'-O-)-methyltransferase
LNLPHERKRGAIALFQPDIAQNLGSIIRLCACTGLPLHVVEPCGFPLDDTRIRRVAMDYVAHVQLIRHRSPEAFLDYIKQHGHRLILLTTKSAQPYTSVAFEPRDILLFGRESCGAPQDIHDAADLRLSIPMQPGLRSLNLAMSSAMLAGELIRQLD